MTPVIEIELKGIMNEVCRVFQITPEELKSESKEEPLVFYRQLYTYVARLLTKAILLDIAVSLGRGEHSAFAHSCSTVQDAIDTRSYAFMQVWTKYLQQASAGFIPNPTDRIGPRKKLPKVPRKMKLKYIESVVEKRIQRPPAIYGNIPSPYGVYSDTKVAY